MILSAVGSKVEAASGILGVPRVPDTRSRDGGIDSLTEHQYLGNNETCQSFEILTLI